MINNNQPNNRSKNNEYRDYFGDDFEDIDILERINRLYEITMDLKKIDKNNPDRDNLIIQGINDYFSDLGIWDNTIDSFFEMTIAQVLENKELENGEKPFGKKSLKNIIGTQYLYDIEDRDELIANTLFLSNRMAKIPELMMARMGWNSNKRQQLSNAYAMYSLMIDERVKNEENTWDYLDEVEFINDNGQEKIVKKSKEYTQFLQNDLKKINEELGTNITALEFYKFARLQSCQSFFYRIKTEKTVEAIQELDVKDYTRFDRIFDSNRALIKINIPGYMYPFLAHVKKDEFEKLTGKKFEDYNLEKELYVYPDFPKVNFKITEKQEQVLQKMRVGMEDETFYRYAMESLNALKKKEEKRTKPKSKMKGKESLKTKKLTNEEINKQMVEYLEKILNSQGDGNFELAEQYKEALTSIVKTTRTNPLLSVYSKIEEFLKEKHKKENIKMDAEEFNNEVSNLYIYMKICKQGFWNCLVDKTGNVFENSYGKCKENFSTFIDLIKEGVEVKDLKSEIRKRKKTPIKSNVETGVKTKRKYTKRKTNKVDEKAEQKNQDKQEISKQEISEQEVQWQDIEDSSKAQDIDHLDGLKSERDSELETNSMLERIIELQNECIAIQSELLNAYNRKNELLRKIQELEKVIQKNEKSRQEKIEESDEILKNIVEERNERGN